MTDSVFVSVGGDELELKRISARQYLSAGAEAEELFREFGGDEVAKAIVMGACLLSRGLFADGDRVFTSAQEILDSMSAEEIIETAQYIELDADTKVEIVEAEKKLRSRVNEEKKSDDRVFETIEGASDSAVEMDERVGESTGNKIELTQMEPSESGRREIGEDAPAVRKSRKTDSRNFYSIYSSVSVGTSPAEYIGSLSPRDDMRRVSDFFQRDSRRYDGAITSY